MKKIIFLSIAIAILASFFASAHPDGLEKVAEDLGFIDKGIERESVMTDYSFPAAGSEGVSTALAGIAGIFITVGLFWVTAKVLRQIVS